MEKPNTDERTPEQRRQFRLVFYLLGLSDILIGVVIAFLFPKYLGRDPVEMQIVGGLMAVLSLPMFWVGYYYSREPKDEKSSSQVFRVRD